MGYDPVQLGAGTDTDKLLKRSKGRKKEKRKGELSDKIRKGGKGKGGERGNKKVSNINVSNQCLLS